MKFMIEKPTSIRLTENKFRDSISKLEYCYISHEINSTFYAISLIIQMSRTRLELNITVYRKF